MLTAPFYILCLVVVFLGIIINLPGSLHINPLLLHFYEPHKVLFLSTVFLTLGALGRVIILWQKIDWREVFFLSISGIIGAFVGSLLIKDIPQKVIVLIFLISGGLYLYKYFKKNKTKEQALLAGSLSGFLSSFLQSFGLSAGVLRQTYLSNKGYDLISVQGIVGAVFTISGLTMIITRSVQEEIPYKETIPILLLFPFILLTIFIAKKVTYKIPKHIQEYIIIYSLIISLVLAIPYLFK